MTETSINKRFLELWEKAKKTYGSKFDKDLLTHLGYNSRNAIAKIKAEGEVSQKLLNLLCEKFNYNLNYIIEGKGSIYKSEITIQKPQDTLVAKNKKFVPYYDIDIHAGNIELFTGKSKELITEMVRVPLMNEAQAFIKVSGNSMIDRYCPGDVIGITPIDFKNGELIQFGEAHLVVTQKQRMLKYVRKGQTKNTWILQSENKAQYDTIEVKISDVVALFMVVGVIRRPIF